MKKTRIIAAALMAAVISAGAGYAAWTDTLNITSTASTGTMNVEFITQEGGFLGIGKYPDTHELGGYVTSTLNQATKVVDVTLNDLYPGSGLLYELKFENKGSIPVKIDSVQVIFDEKNNKEFESLMQQKLVTVGGFVQTRNGWIVDGGLLAFNPLNAPNIIDKDKIHLKDLEKNLNDMLKGKTMEVGDKIALDIPEEYKDDIKELLDSEEIEGFKPDEQNCIIMGLPLNRKNVDNSTMSKDVATDVKVEKTLKFQVKFNFKQFNK